MANQNDKANTLHLPNGANVTVTPIFGGFFFKPNDLNIHQNCFPPGWTIIINTATDLEILDQQEAEATATAASSPDGVLGAGYTELELNPRKVEATRRYRAPTLRNDVMHIASISNPSSTEFRAPPSRSRQNAMMLWTSLWWYFHQTPPKSEDDPSSRPDPNRPKLDWRIRIRREGIFKTRHLISKMERMGLIASEESCVGENPSDKTALEFAHMFCSQKAFWQLDARIFLFTLAPTSNSPYPSQSPYPSRPASPNRNSTSSLPDNEPKTVTGTISSHSQGLWSPASNPFTANAHIPIYYPPGPTQYTMTAGVRHPIRPKPPRQGEIFYTRYVPSVGQYISFRVCSLSPKSYVYHGPIGAQVPSFLPTSSPLAGTATPPAHAAPAGAPPNPAGLASSIASLKVQPQTDTQLLHKWMNDPRVADHWKCKGDLQVQDRFLRRALNSRHSFPAIGCWDGKPFGYFEFYWAKEDALGKCAGRLGDYDQGVRFLVGEQEFRGPQRVRVWMSALVHHCWLADLRTETVLVDPRVDEKKTVNYLKEAGFTRERELLMPFKQCTLMKNTRESWVSPVL